MKKIFKLFLSAALCAAILSSGISFAFAAESPELKLSVISDIHYLPKEYIGSANGFNYRHTVDSDCRLTAYSEEILDASIENIIASGSKYLFISGDMALSTQLESHKEIAQKLRKLADAGISVYVVPGNHDVSRKSGNGTAEAVSFPVDDPTATITVAGTEYVADKTATVAGTTKSQFAEVYSGFGYGNDSSVIARDTTGAQSLSYVAQLDDSHRLIAIDTTIYDGEFSSYKQSLQGELLEWVKAQIAACIAAGDTPIAMMHYDLIEKYPGQSVLLGPNFLDNHKEIAQTLAGCGLEYIFTGHSHANDISSITTNSGNTLFEICTGCLLIYQSPVRYVVFDGADAEFTTKWLKSIEGIPDYEAFCKTYFSESVRTVMRHRGIIDVGDEITGLLSKYMDYDKAYDFSISLMQDVIDGLLNLDLCNSVTLCDVLTEVYTQHYYGDEVYAPEIKAAVQHIKNGDAFDMALPIVVDAIGENTGASKIISSLSPKLEAAINDGISNILTKSLSSLLGAAAGNFVEGIFTDTAPSDNNVRIIDNRAYDGVSGEQQTFDVTFLTWLKNAFNSIVKIFDILMDLAG